MTKHATQYTRVSGFRFTGGDRHVAANGNAFNKPYIIDNNYFFTSGGSGGNVMVDINVNGGVVHHNDFAASSGTSADVFNIVTNEDWSQPPTLGTTDTTGERNIYLEDNTFTNLLETAPDGDSGGRFVIRHNRYVDSSIVFHGGQPTDSSAGGGTRQFEVYDNVFERVSNNSPVNKWIWVRGSSGVIANNTMDRADSPDGQTYPNKPEVRLTLACPSSYPVQYQVGQISATRENPPSRPVLIFGNTGPGTADGNFLEIASSNTAGGSCSSPNTYIQLNRDYYRSNQWGWAPYTYPHPLQNLGTGGGPAPAAPTNLRITTGS
jgi:hypothetical protein